MEPSALQRLGLRSHRLGHVDARALAAARVAALSFGTLGLLIVVAATASGSLGWTPLAGAGGALVLGAIVLGAFERMPPTGNHMIAGAATLIVASLTFLEENGELYAPLYMGTALFACFYFSRRHALAQVLAVCALWIAALLRAQPAADAAAIWAVSAGTLVGTAYVVRATRDRLSRAAARARSQRAVLDAFFLHAPAGFGFLDAELRHLRVNAALAEIMGRSREEIEGATLAEIAPLNAELLEPLARKVLESGEPVIGIEVENPEGRTHLVSYYPVPGLGGIAGVGTAVTDVTHLKDVERRLEETNRDLTILATTDELTGLPNRRMLDEQLTLALARARRSGLAVAVLNVDLDRFKEVNDSLGHAIGDELLVEVADRLRSGARDTDVVARVGGDEFVVVLADLDVQEAPGLAEAVKGRILATLEQPIPIGPVELACDASIGIAVYPLDSRDAKGLLAAADAAMYAGKTAAMRVA